VHLKKLNPEKRKLHLEFDIFSFYPERAEDKPSSSGTRPKEGDSFACYSSAYFTV